ncbi:LysR family transcriptional regulator [Paragemmobacter ruber]|uniref:LysR family transcriptional regulator n=1 Tax=Paragemmobacter ruber TaxID=1985673 RepID=A0ABW9Y602_9RHOB|nr:LysR family transcriptional regulator [Rhodobacter ruber]NBE07827.1 LysR family transcriptional regulator [Rhodobacter ruber]
MSDTDDLLRRGVKLAHLRLMAALAETGQLGLAADLMGVAQPAASRLLAEVERITGQPLHQRTGRGITLTPMGVALARRAARVVTELRDAGREVAEIASGGSGHVRIGSVTGPALDRVLPALRTARLAMPGVTTEVVVAPSDLLGQQLIAGRLDFALGRMPEEMTGQLQQSAPIGTEPVALMARRGHRLAQMGRIEPLDLMGYDWVLPGPEALLTRAVTERLAALGLPKPSQRLATASFLLTLALVQQSNAIAPLARAVCDRFAGPGSPYVILPVDLGIVVAPFGLLTRAGAILTPVAARLAEMIVAQGGEGLD